MAQRLATPALVQIISEQVRGGNRQVTARVVRALIEAAGNEQDFKDWGLESYSADARELVEIEKQPRSAPPPLTRRSRRLEEIERTYPFLSGWTSCCANGWLGLLEQACRHIATIATAEERASLRTVQLKDECGTFRWYLEGGSSRVTSTAMAAELLSVSLCAVCGGVGVLRNREGWYVTLCDACRDLPYPHLVLAIREDWDA